MAVDYQVVFPSEVIKLNSIHLVFGSSPPTIDVYGQDFTAVEEVIVNDLPCPFFDVISKTRMLVVLPKGVPPYSIASINVTSRRLVLTERSLIRFKISNTPAKVAGIFRLTQLYLKLMLSTPGVDIFDQGIGGGILTFVGSNVDSSETGSIVRRFIVANDNVVRQIIAIQSRQPSLPPDEKLLSAKVVSAHFSQQQSALLTSVELTSQAGRAALANLVV